MRIQVNSGSVDDGKMLMDIPIASWYVSYVTGALYYRIATKNYLIIEYGDNLGCNINAKDPSSANQTVHPWQGTIRIIV